MGDYAAKELKFKRVATISDDFAFGHEQMSAFQRVFEDAGGKVVKKLWPPLVTPDYTPFIAQIGNVDGVFNGFAGSNPVKFMRAYADLGLKGKVPLLAGWTGMDDALLRASAMRPSASSRPPTTPPNSAPRATSASWPRCRRTTACCRAAIRPACMSPASASRPPSRCSAAKADDRKALAEALHKVSLTDTPRGAVKFDQYGNVVGEVFIRRCEKKDGKLVNTVIKTYPEREPVLDLRQRRISWRTRSTRATIRRRRTWRTETQRHPGGRSIQMRRRHRDLPSWIGSAMRRLPG